MPTIALRTQTFGSSDQSWLIDPDYAGKVGATLDLSKFAGGQLTGWTSGVQGIVPAGTALGLVTATGKVGPYDDAASDGRQTLAGILWDDVPFVAGDTTSNLSCSRVIFGMVYTAKLPLFGSTVGTAGRLDAAGIADTVVKIAFV